MRKLWLLGCLNVLGVALGQPPTSCIQDTLVIAPGATPVQLGTIQISWPQFNYGIYTVAPGQLTYTVNNGLVGGSVTPLCLVPTDHSSSFVAYSAHITTGPGVQAIQTYWKIPTNGGPFTLNQVTVNYTPGLNVNINPTQLTTVGGAAGYALTLNSSLIPTWLPEAGGITYCPAGVCNSTGSAWGTSYAVGTGANDLVQLNGSAQLPAVSAALLTNFPNVPTATQLNSACPANQYTNGQTCTQPTFSGISGTVDFGQIAPDVLQKVVVNVSSASYLTINSAPVTLVAAQGAGTLVDVDRVVVDYVYGGTTYAGGGSSGFAYGSSSNFVSCARAGYSNGDVNAFTSNGVMVNSGCGALNTSSLTLNTAFVLTSAAAPTTGNGTFTFIVYYRIISGLN